MPPTGVGGGGVRDIRVYGAIQGGIWEISIFTDTMGSMAVWLALRVDGATLPLPKENSLLSCLLPSP